MQHRVETGGQKAPEPQAGALRTSQMSASSFAAYPPQARALVVRNLPLLREVPLPLLPLLLREISAYDWRFPRERQRIEQELAHLQTLPPGDRAALVAPFAALQLPPELSALNWVADPGGYLDALTAALWSSGEMPKFRQAALQYGAAMPVQAAAAGPSRLVCAVLDASLTGTAQFSKLREHGTTLQIRDSDGMSALLEHVRRRASAHPETYAHWYIDGGAPLVTDTGMTQVSYAALSPVRTALLARARNSVSAARNGPEELRSLMSHTTPAQLGMRESDPPLTHFQLSLLTEGSGTQIFSTTFVQWAARECLRRVQPATLLARFTPRQAQQSMEQMMGGAAEIGSDPAGSLIDAEQGAFYTWINLNRLPGAAAAHFLAWHAGSDSAIAIGPGFARGTTSPTRYTMQQVLNLLT